MMDNTSVRHDGDINQNGTNDKFRKSGLIQLDGDFFINRYGLFARLVNESDVDFILSLRTDKELTKYIHPTEESRENQLNWIKNYKLREAEGREYYFIFFYNGEPVGLNRVYNRSELYATSGSWLCKPGIEDWIPIAINFTFNDILFEILDIKLVVCDVRINNKKVNKYHVLIGDQKIYQSDIDNFYYRTVDTFVPKRDKFVKLYHLNLK